MFQQMVNIATFDIIPKDDWYPVWFSLPIDEPLNDRFADLGLGSKFFIMNFGTLFLALVVLQLQTCGYVFVAVPVVVGVLLVVQIKGGDVVAAVRTVLNKNIYSIIIIFFYVLHFANMAYDHYLKVIGLTKCLV